MRTRAAVRSIADMVTVLIIFFVAERTVTAEGLGGYQSEQGTRLFGTRDPKLEGIFIPYAPTRDAQQPGYESLIIKAGQLKMELNGAEVAVAGKVLPMKFVVSTQPTVTLVIREARQHKSIYTKVTSPNVWEYDVMVEGGPNSGPLCDDSQNLALVVPGAWKIGQLSQDKDTGFTFSCVPILVSDSASTSPAPNSAQVTVQKAPQVTRQPLSLTTSRRNLPTRDARRNEVITSLQGGATAHLIEFRSLIEHPQWHGGATAKCIDYGYAPWASGVPVLGQPTVTGGKMPPVSDANARSFHNVCVHVMTADYAGNGQSHTISGAAVRIFDLTDLHATMPIHIGRFTGPRPSQRPATSPAARVAPDLHADKIMARPNIVQGATQQFGSLMFEIAAPRFEGLMFEGLWMEDKGNAHAYCLAKARWQTIDAFDPRLSGAHNRMGESNGSWTYCDELRLGDLSTLARSNTTMLISYSAINERGLWRFPNGTGWVTTTHVEFTKDGPKIGGGLPCASPCIGERVGNILSPDAPLKGLDDIVPLYMYKKDDTNEYATLTMEHPPKGYSVVHLSGNLLSRSRPQRSFVPPHLGGNPEGYLFKKQPSLPEWTSHSNTGVQAPRLQLWQHEKSYCTTSEPDSATQSRSSQYVIKSRTPKCEGYHLVNATLGFLLIPGAERDIYLPLLASTRSLIIPVGDPGPDDPTQKPEETLETKEAVQQQVPMTMQNVPMTTQLPMATEQTPQ